MTVRQSYYSDEQGREYNDTDLWKAAEGLTPLRLHSSAMLDALSDEERALAETMLDDYRRIERASQRYPLILTPDGFLADGYHRLVQALLAGGYVEFVRLAAMPSPRMEGDNET